MAKQSETKDFQFELKEVSDTGSFTGILSVYNVVDLGKDLVEPGAFTKTLQESGGEVPCLYRHEDPIGTLSVTDTGSGLEVKGQLILDSNPDGSPSVPDAYKALALMRKRVVRGMSIGFMTIKSAVVDGVRHLKELSLKEGSVVLFPMLPLAQITSVKEDKGVESKMTFDEALADILTWRSRYDCIQALDTVISTVLYDQAATTDDAVAQIAAAVQTFGTQITELIPKLRALLNSTYGYDFKRLAEIESKAGRKISAASRTKIEEAMKQLQALLDDESAEESGTGKSATPPETKGVSESGAAPPNPEPDDLHSVISDLRKEMQWN